MQKQITQKQPLLDEFGQLVQPGLRHADDV